MFVVVVIRIAVIVVAVLAVFMFMRFDFLAHLFHVERTNCEQLVKRLCGQHTGLLKHADAVAEDHQRRDRTDAERTRQLLFFIGVDFCQTPHRYAWSMRLQNRGANARHGPHQGAQKSNMTMPGLLRVDSEVLSGDDNGAHDASLFL